MPLVRAQIPPSRSKSSCLMCFGGALCGKHGWWPRAVVQASVAVMERHCMKAESASTLGVVQADFAFFDPKPSDFHGVKILLQNYLGDEEWDLSGFVDLILGQTTVGTVVKIEGAEDDGLFSVVSALNLDRYKDHKCFIELKEYLLKVCPGNNVISDLRALLKEQAQRTGLLVSQHVMNFPPQLVPPLYDALFDEVSWATEDEPTEELRNSFEFSHYLLVSKIIKLKSGSKKSKQNGNRDKDADILFSKLKDEFFISSAHGPSVFLCTLHQLQIVSLRITS